MGIEVLAKSGKKEKQKKQRRKLQSLFLLLILLSSLSVKVRKDRPQLKIALIFIFKIIATKKRCIYL